MSFGEGDATNPFHRGFRALGSMNEVRLFPGTRMLLPLRGCQESITYVREGGLMVRDHPRREELFGPGTCQRATTRRVRVTGATGKSPFQGAQIFVSSITPQQNDGASSFEHRHYPFSDRRGTLRLIASPDPNAASLQLHQDVRIYSSILDPGHHVIHELSPGRGVWLHVVSGKIFLIDQSLRTGDGASLDDELAVSFTAQEDSEVLLFDLA
jgi:redox-sensitive bicupin YhaK (pirin superfamily)